MLTWFPSHEPLPREIDAEVGARRRRRSYWLEWAARCDHHGRLPRGDPPVAARCSRRSRTRRPAASSPHRRRRCPEWIGGVRNWDYRYCWLRDATLTLLAMLHAGYRDEAMAWRQWLLRAVAGDPADVQIMYGIAGERRLDERVLDWLPGFEGSAPGARRQRRLAAAAARRLRRGRSTRSTRPASTARRPTTTSGR